MTKNYKDFEKQYIGTSDIATLILAGFKDGEGLTLLPLHFGEDNAYRAYIVDGADVEIGALYTERARFSGWMKVYDDDELVKKFEANEIVVYRAGELGCIIQIIKE